MIVSIRKESTGEAFTLKANSQQPRAEMNLKISELKLFCFLFFILTNKRELSLYKNTTDCDEDKGAFCFCDDVFGANFIRSKAARQVESNGDGHQSGD
ncbi:MAG: hypothetical protein QM734_12215 [Cyclobacteriaceae bacterium]